MTGDKRHRVVPGGNLSSSAEMTSPTNIEPISSRLTWPPIPQGSWRSSVQYPTAWCLHRWPLRGDEQANIPHRSPGKMSVTSVVAVSSHGLCQETKLYPPLSRHCHRVSKGGDASTSSNLLQTKLASTAA